MNTRIHIPAFPLPAKSPARFNAGWLGLLMFICLADSSLFGEHITGEVTVDHGAWVSDYLGYFGTDIYIGVDALDLSEIAADEPYHTIQLSAPEGGILNGDDASLNTLTISANLSAGNLSADGNLSIDLALTLGTWYAGDDVEGQPIYYPGLALLKNTVEGISRGSFSGTSPEILWKWQQNGADSPANLMTLDTNGVLSLFDPANSHSVAIDPANATFTLATNSTSNTISLVPVSANYSSVKLFDVANGGVVFATDENAITGPESISVGSAVFGQTGTYSSPGNAFFIGSSQSITLDPGNQTIAFVGGRTISPGNIGALFGTANITIGNYTTASGTGALAIMANSTASGTGAVAVSNGSASGNFAIALGGNSSASADGAIALQGGNATANGSLAIGAGAIANGTLAVAMGTNVTAQTWGAVALGRYNTAISGNATTLVSTDPAFIVGMGQNSTTRANALVILNNGNATANNSTLLVNSGYVSATNTTQPLELQVNQNTILNGQASLNGVVIISQPQGDVPMGGFGN